MFYPRQGTPEKLLEAEPERKADAHMAAFFEAIRTGRPPKADIKIAATAALTAILGREAIYRKQVMNWSDLAVDV
jgi:hypothetical protein